MPRLPPQPLAVLPTGRPPELKSLHILVAEDNRTNQTVATRMLGKMGHAPVVANNGKEALLLLTTHRFDLVLMDIQMPEMDGLTTTRKIRESENGTRLHMPIIAMTAHAMKGDRERCLAAGMDGYVSKPVSSQELEKTIAGVLLGRGDREAVSSLLAKPADAARAQRPQRDGLGYGRHDGTIRRG